MSKRIPTGRVFQRTYTDRHGVTRTTSTYYLKFYVHGKPVEVPTGTSDYEEALCMLRQRMANVARFGEHSEEPQRVLINQLLDLVLDDYRLKSRRSTYDTEHRIDKHLRPFFGSRKATELTTSMLKRYIALRQKEAEAATINKELSYLRRGFRLGLRNEPRLVESVPFFPMLEVDNAREGMLSHEEYRTIRDSLPLYARIALVISYHTGSRKGEVRRIRIDKIDFGKARIDLPGRVVKNKKPRFLPIYGDMRAELEMAIAAADPKCPFLVQNEGKPVFDWEKSWKTACKLAQIDNALFHDLRRTALTNMIEGGISEKEAMEISGHKTRAVFDRYHIVSERRLKQIGERLEQHMRAKEQELLGSDSGVRQDAKIQ